MRRKAKLRCSSLKKTTKDYASQSSIHGIGYIFDHKLGTWERVLWLMVVIGFLILATHLTLDTWTQWQEEQVVTTLKNTAKPVAEVPFPAVTICGIGNHMNNVEKKIQENFALWREENQRNQDTGDTSADNNERLVPSSEANRSLVVQNVIILYVIIWNSLL